MPLISNDKNVGSNAIQDIKDFNKESLATHAKTGEHLVSMTTSVEKAFDFNG